MIDRVPKFMDTPADEPHFGIIQSRKKKTTKQIYKNIGLNQY